ncbi:MAG: hypothetical protein JSC085_000260 [Candidatus Tokpelaia sp. JSC085]|nr:MAG: hypothetical protein JSC085_000260 [Candidatus Tokpelaia sp. JSC085]
MIRCFLANLTCAVLISLILTGCGRRGELEPFVVMENTKDNFAQKPEKSFILDPLIR